MMTQYRCRNEQRRLVVGATVDAQGNPIQPKLNGIDYLEVASDDQKTLKVFFLHNLPGQPNGVPAAPPLTNDNIVIEGGVRVKGIHVVAPFTVANNVLTLTVSDRGDFSTYTLRIVTSQTEPLTPPGFDTQLAAVDFSFKIDCPSDFDCKQTVVCPPAKLDGPSIDYLAKDYASFRRLILDRMSAIMPEWTERSPADLGVALVEMEAYAGDHLSYYQDAVATEAYLGTARRRVSARRHARLLDYFVHDGTNARTWICLEVTKGSAADLQKLPGPVPGTSSTSSSVGTRLLTRGTSPQAAVAIKDLEKELARQPVVFEAMHDITLNSAQNRISFYTWSDRQCCLPRGATQATLLDTGLGLTPGDVLIFEELLGPVSGAPADADPSHRHAVRLTTVTSDIDRFDGTKVVRIEWGPKDALPFALCLTAQVIGQSGQPVVSEISVARGNVVLADHGRSLPQEKLVPPFVPDTGNYRPQLRLSGVTFRVPYDDAKARQSAAAAALEQDVRQALPAASLNDGSQNWVARRDLFSSHRFAPDFVVEVERDGAASLRFGDGTTAGKKPDGGLAPLANYRVGNGRAGNLGAEAITRVVSDLAGFERVRNPLPASGGVDGETMEEIRQFAPQAFRTQERAVTEADWAEVTQRHAEVQKAAATFRWTGSWYTVFITIDRKGGLSAQRDPNFRRDMESFLDQFRIAGYDLEIKDPVAVPLDIQLLVCVKAGYFNSNVKQTLMSVFSSADLPDGSRGFFHPDNFTFGQPVYLSQIYKVAMGVTGVASVEATVFQRWGKLPNHELENAVLTPAALEIIQLDNDPNFPENGRILFDTQGGL